MQVEGIAVIIYTHIYGDIGIDIREAYNQYWDTLWDLSVSMGDSMRYT